MAGFRVVFQHKELRVLMGLFTAQTLVAGLMLVFLVVVAIELLDIGDAGVGYLNSAFGVGALVGAIGALGLTGARRLSPGFLVGLLLWGLPLAVLGLWSSIAIALVLFAIMGAGNSLVDVAGYTLVQRAVPDAVLARVFGVLQFFLLTALGIGGVLAPVLSDLFGLENALIVSGLFLPVLVLLFGRTVAKIDAQAAAPGNAGVAAAHRRADLGAAAGHCARAHRRPARAVARRTGDGHRPRRRRRRSLLRGRRGPGRGDGRGQAREYPGAGRLFRRDRPAQGRAAYGDGHRQDARRSLRARAAKTSCRR